MAAGLGFKTFTTGEVLTAADTNGYLMQGVLVFASSAARAAAITSPQEGQYSYLKDTNSTEYYDGAAWIAAPIGDITGVTAGTGISGGGTSGTVTVSIDTAVTVDKTTAQTLTNKTLTSPALTTPTISTATTNGDLLYGTGSGALTRLGIGSSAQVLTVASGVPSWATPAVSASGLTKISSASFSAVANTGTTFDGVFTSTYTNYVIVVNGSAGNDLKWQARKSGTTHASDYLFGGQAIPYTGSASLIQGSGSSWTVQTFSGGNQNQVTINVSNVGTGSQLPVFTSIGANYSYGGVTVNGGIINNSIATTGFILSVPSGTMTGTAYVYGLAV